MAQARDSVEAAEENYLAAWRLLVDRAEGCRVEETDEVLFTFVPNSVAFFNSAFVKPPADPSACVATIETFFAARRTPFTVRFRSSREASAFFRAEGFAPAELSPLMNAAIDDIMPPLPLDIRRVEVATWDAHTHTIAGGFDLPIELVVRLFGPSLSESHEYAAFNAYIDGEVASTAALFVSDMVAGVYNVATPERFRRRGLGEAATRAAVAEGRRRGCATTTLQASEMGYPIYERMGYRTVVAWQSMTSS
jgi:GNAT superfamily N-acetyltransferase